MSGLTLSNSRLACMRRCPRKFKYRYVHNLVADQKAPALVLGSTVHKGLEMLYSITNEELDPQSRAEMVMTTYDNEVERVATEIAVAGGDQERFNKDSFMGRQMLKYYLEEIFPTDDFIPIASEIKIETRIPNPKGKFTWGKFTGFVDALVERDGRIYILEHKTAKDLSVNHLILDTQVTQYIWGLRQEGIPVEGVYYNILRKIDPYSARSKAPYHYREAVFRNDREIEECSKDLYNQYMQMRHMDRYGYYRNPTRDCNWDCEYRAICIHELDGELPEEDFRELVECNGFHIKDPILDITKEVKK